MNSEAFIRMVAPLAVREMGRSHVLASVTIAQACLESAYGESELAKEANNLFGMKTVLSGNTWDSVWQGDSYEKETKEQDKDGREYTITASFRKYPDINSSIVDHTMYLLGARDGDTYRYTGLSGEKDYKRAAGIIKAGGYATDLSYVDKLCRLIEAWGLTRYDGGKKMRICLDAGHYGKYNQSPCDKAYYESDMVWKLHLLQKKYLEGYGAEVITTRPNQRDDLELYSRGVKSAGCDLFISDHSNAAGKSTIDYPVSYCVVSGAADGIGKELADCVMETMGTRQLSRIEKRKGSRGDYYGVLRGAAAVGTPGIILEHSFHTNPEATAWLMDDNNLDLLAREEARTIAMHYGLKKVIKSGWVEEDGGERFYLGDTGECVKNDWYQDNGKWYWFNGAGFMVTGTWYKYKGGWYYLGEDGAMVKGLVNDKGKWYYLDTEGRMATDPVLLVPDEDGALRYPGLIK